MAQYELVEGQRIPVNTSGFARVGVPFAAFAAGVFLFAQVLVTVYAVRGDVPWLGALVSAPLLLGVATLVARDTYLAYQHIEHAAYRLDGDTLRYWDWRGVEHAVPLAAIRCVRDAVKGLPATFPLAITYEQGDELQTLVLQYTRVWDDGLKEAMIRYLREHAGLTVWKYVGWLKGEEYRRAGWEGSVER